jgi:hypothetical protein
MIYSTVNHPQLLVCAPASSIVLRTPPMSRDSLMPLVPMMEFERRGMLIDSKNHRTIEDIHVVSSTAGNEVSFLGIKALENM